MPEDDYDIYGEDDTYGVTMSGDVEVGAFVDYSPRFVSERLVFRMSKNRSRSQRMSMNRLPPQHPRVNLLLG